MASLGGFTIAGMRWTGLNSLTVDVQSPYTDKVYQLYCGRSLVGVTNTVGLYTVTGQCFPSLCPAPISIVMADLVDRDTDFGALLPRRPWNKYRLRWNANTFPSDALWFSVHGSPAPGDPIDYATTLMRTPFAGDGNYAQDLPELTACGQWSYGVVPRDNALPEGNAGTAAEKVIQAIVYPPDVLIDDNDKRLTVSVASGIVTVGFQYDWPDA